MSEAAPSRSTAEARRVPWWVFLVLVLLVTVVPAFVSVVLLDATIDQAYPDLRSVVVDFVAPSAISLGIIGAMITGLRIWGPIIRDRRPVRRWLWIVPASLIVTAVVATDFRRVAEAPGVAAVGLIGILLLVTSEELVFRGVVLHEARRRTTEFRAAWISSITFGLVHALGGPVQVVVSTAFGHMAYYTRRVSGGIALPIVVHWAWNGSLFTGLLGAEPSYEGMASVYLTLVSFAVLGILALARRRIDIDPAAERASEPHG